MTGIDVPAEIKVIVGEATEISLKEPFAYEKLSPTLAMYKVINFDDAVDKAVSLIELGGIGHTAAYLHYLQLFIKLVMYVVLPGI